ncbi:MAG: DUF1963 domain-containing protein, partial [Acutalibacteraceae bacterium]
MKLRIIEEAWGINRRSGERSTRVTDNRAFAPEIGSALDFPTGRRNFTIDAVDENSITVTVHYENTASNKTWVIAKGESQFYRPRSMDGGYQYRIIYEDEAAPCHYAIAMTVNKAEEEHNPAQSKFFGSPVLPSEWQDRFHDDIVFFAQIRLADIAKLDYDNRLPHTGYLYFFLDAEMYPSDQLDMWVEYYPGEPDTVIDDFNTMSPIPEGLNDDWLIDFRYADS